jgi:hypothetical protein
MPGIPEFRLAFAELTKGVIDLVEYVKAHPESRSLSDVQTLHALSEEFPELQRCCDDLQRAWQAAITSHNIFMQHVAALAERGFDSNDPGMLDRLNKVADLAERQINALGALWGDDGHSGQNKAGDP